MDIGKRIERIRQTQGLTQRVVAQRCAISQGALSNIENGKKQPTLAMLERLCASLNITLRDFFADGVPDALSARIQKLLPAQREQIEGKVRLYEAENLHQQAQAGQARKTATKTAPKIAAPKVVGYVAAGAPIEAVEQGLDVNPAQPAPKGTQFGLLVRGDSMEPRIPNGSVIWLDATANVASGQIGVFLLDSGEATCKKLEHTGKRIRLLSLNEKYAPIDIPAGESLRLVGKVIGWSDVIQ